MKPLILSFVPIFFVAIHGTVIANADEDTVETKCQRIVVPQVEFEDTPLPDAIEFLRQKSIELDSLEQDPKLKGINIILLGAVQTELRREGDIRISMKASHAPISTLLHYVAQISGYQVDFQPHAVVIGRSDEIIELRIAMDLEVPPAVSAPGGRKRIQVPVPK